MKRLRHAIVVVIVILAVTALGSCNFLGLGNHMNIDGTRYDLDAFYVVYEGTEAGVHGLALIFTSQGLNLTDQGPTGSGELLGLFVISPSRDLAGGNYEFNYALAPFVLLEGWAGVGYNASTNDAQARYWVTGGSVKVREALRDNYVFDFDFKGVRDGAPEGSPLIEITGRFRGPIDRTFDDSIVGSELPLQGKFRFAP